MTDPDLTTDTLWERLAYVIRPRVRACTANERRLRALYRQARQALLERTREVLGLRSQLEEERGKAALAELEAEGLRDALNRDVVAAEVRRLREVLGERDAEVRALREERDLRDGLLRIQGEEIKGQQGVIQRDRERVNAEQAELARRAEMAALRGRAE